MAIKMLIPAPLVTSSCHLHLDPQTQRFFLNWQNSSAALKLDVQCASFVESLSRGLATKQGPLNQALGKKTRRIFDATGGWGNDSMLFCKSGYGRDHSRAKSNTCHDVASSDVHFALNVRGQLIFE